jgi:hypothetical protein
MLARVATGTQNCKFLDFSLFLFKTLIAYENLKLQGSQQVHAEVFEEEGSDFKDEREVSLDSCQAFT